MNKTTKVKVKSLEASRLGRRPKRLKDTSGEGSRAHSNLPIALRLLVSELQLRKALRATNGTYEHILEFREAERLSFREHAKTDKTQTSSAASSSSSAVVQVTSTSSLGTGRNSIISTNNNNNAQPSSNSLTMVASPVLTGQQQQPGNFLSVDNNSNTLMTSAPPSPFNELNLSLSEFYPVEPNSVTPSLTTGSSGKTPPGGMYSNINGNSAAYSPGPNTDTMPSPLGIPSIDQVDLAVSPSTFMTFNPNSVGGGSNSIGDPMSPGNFNINVSLVGQAGLPGTAMSPKPELKPSMNFNIKTESLSPPGTSGLLSPAVIKKEINRDRESSIDYSTEPFYLDPQINCLSDVNKVLAEVKKTPTEKRQLLINQVTDAIVEAHVSTTLNTQKNIREANERIMSQQGMPQNHMPDMSQLSHDPTILWQLFLNSLVPEITKVVKFSKKLPGFSDVEMDDQIRLIKQGSFEVMIARITLLIDHVNETMIDPSLKMKSTRSLIRDIPPLGHFLNEFFDIAKELNPLSLTDGENGLFGAILMLCPDRVGLENIGVIHTIQQLYLQALYLLMRRNHKDADETFCSLISTLPLIRKINDDHFRYLNNIRMKSATEFESNFPDLHRELYQLSGH
ncbi:nuclear receptor subfamily 1 DEF [Elysia marginata]|uniref:Nuclear receptor subfamily 1 DEF n=1 Tax=Elysia marginata TaxID=1093978 RepID=A0AAV4G786_9GAST|nr:nuclear receptor subfamily 1 DEF [Elysia marginata]